MALNYISYFFTTMKVYTEYTRKLWTMLDKDIRYRNTASMNNAKQKYIFINWKLKEFFAVAHYRLFQLSDKEYKSRLNTNPKSKSPYVKAHYKVFARRWWYIYATNEQVRNDYKLTAHGLQHHA